VIDLPPGLLIERGKRSVAAEAEQHGHDFGCHSAFVDTFTFQGPEFYPKLGYREYARLDYPPDHHRIFFRKNLDINVVKGCWS
jgi:hypothetical protein